MNEEAHAGVDGRRMFGVVGLVALSVMAMVIGLPGHAAAEPNPNPASIVAESVQPAGELDLAVRSTAMRRNMTVKVLPAKGDRPAPTLYLLNGAAGGDGGSSWFDRTDIRTYFADQNVNVVVPMGGAASYFTDWQHPDPVLGGVQKWATFLTSELPAVIDRRLDTNGRNAVAGGISMAGTSVFQLSLHAPGAVSGARLLQRLRADQRPVGPGGGADGRRRTRPRKHAQHVGSPPDRSGVAGQRSLRARGVVPRQIDLRVERYRRAGGVTTRSTARASTATARNSSISSPSAR